MALIQPDIIKRLAAKTLCAAAALLTLSLSACDSELRNNKVDLSELTPQDSLLYYSGQLRAHDYWQDAVADTTLRNTESRKEFLRGLEDGLEAVRGEATAYNKGLRLGVNLAENIIKFEDDYDIKLHRVHLYNSIKEGLSDDHHVNAAASQDKFYEVLGHIRQNNTRKELESSKKELTAYARSNSMKRLADDLYYRTITPGSGPLVSKGDSIHVEIKYTHTDGTTLGMPSPSNVLVGAPESSEIATLGFTNMHQGEKAVFVTNAHSLLYDQAALIDLHPGDVVLVTVTIHKILSSSNPEATTGISDAADTD